MVTEYSETFIVLREREPGVWVFMDECQIMANTPFKRDKDCAELAVRGYMSKSRNTGGRFAVVAKRDWRTAVATYPEAVVERETEAA